MPELDEAKESDVPSREEAEAQARALIASGGDMAQVQVLLRDLGISVSGSVWTTAELLEGHSLAEAKEVVLTSAARAEEAAAHRRLLTALEHSLAIAEAVRELGRPAVVAFDGPGEGPGAVSGAVAGAVAQIIDDAAVVSTNGADWVRLREEVLVPARAGLRVTLVHGCSCYAQSWHRTSTAGSV